MNRFPRISIITPSFNQGCYIEETILSVINQSYKNVELIIIDGGSTDNTVEIIKKYEERISFWVSEKDKGQTDAILKGLQKCTGEIFNWINSDDLLAENCLEKIAAIYINQNMPDLIAGNIIRFDESGTHILHLHINNWNNIPRTLGMGQMCQPGMFYKTEVVRKIGMNANYHFSMDIDLFFRYNFFLKKTNSVFVNQLFAEFRMHGSSKTLLEQGKSEQSAFLLERIEIIYYFIQLLDDRKARKKMRYFLSNNDLAIRTNYVGKLPNEKKRLLRNVIDYFLLDQLFISFQTFEKKKIIALFFKINWFKIPVSLTIAIFSRILRHFSLFLKNSFTKTFLRQK